MSHKVIPPAQSSAQVTAAIARDAPQFSDIIEPVVPLRLAQATTTAGAVSDTVYLYRFRVAEAITIANAAFFNGATAAGTVAFGVYTSDGTTWTKVASTPDTAAAGTNAYQTIALSAPYALQPGTDYWAAFGGNGHGTLTILRAPSMIANLGAMKNMALAKASVYSSGLPATITTPTSTSIPFFFVFTT